MTNLADEKNVSVADYFERNTFLEHQVEQIKQSHFGDDILYIANQVRLTLNQDHKKVDEFAVLVSDKLNSKRLNELRVVESLMLKYNCSIVFAKPAFDLIKDLKINIEAPLSKAAYEEVGKAISAEKEDGPTSQRLSNALKELSKHELDKDLFQDTIDKIESLPESKLFQGKLAKESTKEMTIKAPVSEKTVDFSPTI